MTAFAVMHMKTAGNGGLLFFTKTVIQVKTDIM